MKYFFAENCDWIDPQYDFEQERSSVGREPQLDDLYPHEYFDSPPYDGLLVSRSIVGGEGFLGRYTQGQRHRLQREGVRSFLRFPHTGYSGDPMAYPIMGDCGSYSYIDKAMPAVTNEQIIGYYTTCGFTHAVSVDHIIVAKKIRWDDQRRLPNWVSARAEFTYQSALEFLHLCRSWKARFVPIGVVQSWSPRSAARYAKKLVSAGYDYIGLGGLVGRSWQYIFNTISEVRAHIPSDTRIHVFGFAYLKKIEHFVGLNIASFDSTAPVLKAFKDDRENYYADTDPHYTAIRIPPLNEDQVKRRILSGRLDHNRTQYLENRALSSVRRYGKGQTDLESTMEDVLAYESHLYGKSGIFPHYRRTLADRPWEKCTCRACRELGVEVVVYRGL